MSNQCETLEHFCFAQTWNSPVSIRKIGSVRHNNLFFYCYSFCKNILKYLSRMARVSLRRAERSMFLSLRTVSDASGLCKCSIKVPFVVRELTVNNNNNDILIHFLQRKTFNLQMHRLLVHLVHLDTCIYFCLLLLFCLLFLARAWLSIHTAIICINNERRPACYVILCTP